MNFKYFPVCHLSRILNSGVLNSKNCFKSRHTCRSFSKSKALKLDLRGIYPPITTPFTENDQVAFEKLKSNLVSYQSISFRGYVVFGSTGEFVSLAEQERLDIIKCIKNTVPKDKLVICGSGCQSTKGTIELTQKMADCGADAALIISPSFYKGRMTDDALYAHYYKVAENSPIPIILYSVPANTSIDLSPSLIVKLADHSNIIGLKDSGGDISKIGYIVHKTIHKEFQVIAGSAGFFYSALCVGCVGGIMALANVLGEPLTKLQYLFDMGKHDEARVLQHKLIGPNLCVTKRYGISGVKFAMDKSGLNLYGGPTRLPLLPLMEQEMHNLTQEFKENGFF